MHESFSYDPLWRSGSMRYANSLTLDLLELKHAESTERTENWQVKNTTNKVRNVQEMASRWRSQFPKEDRGRVFLQYLTACLLLRFRHFKVRKHICGICWFDSSCGLIFVQWERMDLRPLEFLFCGVSFFQSSS